MSDQVEKMRQLVAAKKQKNAGQSGINRPEKNLTEKNMKVTKQHKKGGLFDGK